MNAPECVPDRPSALLQTVLLLRKNAMLRCRAWRQALVEVLLPAVFLLTLLPARLASPAIGSDTAQLSYPPHAPPAVNFTEHYAALTCAIEGAVPGVRPCEQSWPQQSCIGALCLEVDPEDDDAVEALFDPVLKPIGFTVPDFDTMALLRKVAETAPIPGESDFGVNVANAISTGHHLAVVGPEAGSLREYLNATTYTYKYISKTFTSEKEARDFAASSEGSRTMWAIVTAETPTAFTISMNRTSTPSTDGYKSQRDGWLSVYRLYATGGWATLQDVISRHASPGFTAAPLQFYPMPIPPYHQDLFLEGAGPFIPLVLVLALLYPCSQAASRFAAEKESGIRQGMLVMGLHPSALRASWLLTAAVQGFITGFLAAGTTALVLSVPAFGKLLLVCILFCTATAFFSLIVASPFEKPSAAAAAAAFAFLLSAVPMFALNPSTTTAGLRHVFSVFPPYALSGGITALLGTDENPSYTFAMSAAWLAGDVLLYLLAALVADGALPVRKRRVPHVVDSTASDIESCNPLIEPDSETSGNAAATVSVRGLRKNYDWGAAVDGVDLTLHEGKVLVLLGANGAGKTTLIKMLTGADSPTAGTIAFEGGTADVGICPQHNILWDEMTCEEHLRFYQRLKRRDGCEDEVQRLLEATGLQEKQHALAKHLSGGTKRKLCIGMALVGGSKLVVLDEPTAGIDVQARRRVWDLVRGLRGGRTVLMTTHFMDEADLLGDRVAVMRSGKLHCSGSPFFLKQRLGVGYQLKLEMGKQGRPDIIFRTIKAETGLHDGDVELLSHAGSELSYRLPSAALPQIPGLLETLDAKKSSLGVNSYGLSITTLEEVFLKIAEGNYDTAPVTLTPTAETPLLRRQEELLKGEEELLWAQWQGLLYKRLRYASRDRRTLCMQLVLPLVLVSLALILSGLPVPDLPAITVAGLDTPDTVLPIGPLTNPWILPDRFAMAGLRNIQTAPVDAATPEDFEAYLLDASLQRPDDLGCWQGLFGEELVFFNVSALHSVPFSLSSLASARLGAPLSFKNDPMPFSHYFRNWIDGWIALQMGLFIVLPFALIPAGFAAFLVSERETHAKHLQFVSGVRPTAYWGSNVLVDILSFATIVFLCMMVFLVFGRDEYTGSPGAFTATLVLLLSYGAVGALCAYCASFFFSKPGTALGAIGAAYFFTGFALVATVATLQQFSSTEGAADALRYVFRLLPAFALGDGFVALSQLPSQHSNGINLDLHPWSMGVAGADILFLMISLPIYAIGVVVLSGDFELHIPYLHALRSEEKWESLHLFEDEEEDEDVAAERVTVTSGTRNDVVRVEGLQKVYPDGTAAVRNVTFGVPENEIFAFLGSNGAGKSSTLGVLAGDLLPTAGHASISGHDVVDSSAAARRALGYCPQADALLPLLTPLEHLVFFSALRGVPRQDRLDTANALVRTLGLSGHENTPVCKLSGGNKRKTSIAVAMVGSPACLLLDEPTAGIDPVGRRALWNTLQRLRERHSIILTTHHLEEVEALAQRVAVMSKGRLRCLGTLMHLKAVHGGGYQLELKAASPDGIRTFFGKELPVARLLEETGSRLTYTVPAGKGLTLSALIRLLEDAKESLGISDYSVTQPTLEQVFMAVCSRVPK